MRRRGLPKHMADVTDSFPVWTRREQMELDDLKYEVRVPFGPPPTPGPRAARAPQLALAFCQLGWFDSTSDRLK